MYNGGSSGLRASSTKATWDNFAVSTLPDPPIVPLAPYQASGSIAVFNKFRNYDQATSPASADAAYTALAAAAAEYSSSTPESSAQESGDFIWLYSDARRVADCDQPVLPKAADSRAADATDQALVAMDYPQLEADSEDANIGLLPLSSAL
jgi:hypothetical protein